MSFVIPSKYGANSPLPKDPSVRITEVPRKIVAAVAFSGLSSPYSIVYIDILRIWVIMLEVCMTVSYQ